jgi:hypothetical protein
MERPRVTDGGDMEGCCGQPTTGVPPAWGLGKGLKTHHCKKSACYKMLRRASELAGCCEHGNEPSGSIKGRKFD